MVAPATVGGPIMVFLKNKIPSKEPNMSNLTRTDNVAAVKLLTDPNPANGAEMESYYDYGSRTETCDDGESDQQIMDKFYE